MYNVTQGVQDFEVEGGNKAHGVWRNPGACRKCLLIRWS